MLQRSARTRFHADDFGLNDIVNGEIERLLASGQLDSVSMMANTAGTADAAALIQRHPDARIDLHFNLTEGQPLAPVEELGHLVDRDGNFLGLRRLLTVMLVGRIRPEAVACELNAQLDQLTALGVPLTGIDTHHHVHAFSPISEVVREVADARGLVCDRRYEMLQTHTLWGRWKKVSVAVAARTTHLRSKRTFALPVTWSSGPGQPFAVASWEPLPDDITERPQTIICHPGNGCDLSTPIGTQLVGPRPGELPVEGLQPA